MNAPHTPVKTKASAPVTGANGGALASVIIKEAEQKGRADLKAEKPMKARLFDLIKLNGDDHVAFRASLQKYLDGVEADAKKLGLTVTQHREANAVVNSICSTLSMWRKLVFPTAAKNRLRFYLHSKFASACLLKQASYIRRFP